MGHGKWALSIFAILAGCDTAAAPSCGDYSVDPDEECDLGMRNADDGLCTSECMNARCGDGLVAPDESCDDANDDPNDGCAACRLPGEVIGSRPSMAGDIVATDRLHLQYWGAGPGPWIEVQAFDGAPLVDLLSDFEGDSHASSFGAMAVDPDGFVVATHGNDATSTYETGMRASIARFSPDGLMLWSSTIEPPSEARDDTSSTDISAAGTKVAIAGILHDIISIVIGGGGDWSNYALVAALDSSSGSILWTDTFDVDGLLTVAWQVTTDSTGFTCVAGTAGLDAEERHWLRCYSGTGVLAWHIEVPSPILALELRADELLAIDWGSIVTLDRASGAQLSAVPLAFSAPRPAPSRVELEGDRMIRFDDMGLAVFGLDGAELWTSAAGTFRNGARGASIGQDGRLYAIDNAENTLVWFEPHLP